MTRREAGVGFALFLLIGAVGAIFGPVVPSFRSTFGVTAAVAGLLVSGHFAGAVIGILWPNLLPPAWRTTSRPAGLAVCIFAAGCVLLGLAPNPVSAMGGAVVEGTGWGMLVVCFNTLFAGGFGERSAAMLSLLNAVFGIGSIAGPAAVGLLFAGRYRPPFLAAAVLALVCAPFAFRLPHEPAGEPGPAASENSSGSSAGPVLAAFIILFFLLGGLEGGIGTWEATQLVSVGFTAAGAATITSLLWMTYTAGRLLSAPLSLRVRPQWVLPGTIGGITVLMLLTPVTGLPAVTYTLAGFGIGPNFPMALLWVTQALASRPRAASLVIASDLFGGVLFSAGLGKLISAAGVSLLPIAFAAIAGAALAVCLGLLART
jgi:fucose permease